MKAVLWIRNVIPDSNFSIPDLGSKRFRIPEPDPRQRIYEVPIFNPKNCFKARKNDLGCSSPYQDPDFFPILDPGLGSRIL
jgi:hypothetical protein